MMQGMPPPGPPGAYMPGPYMQPMPYPPGMPPPNGTHWTFSDDDDHFDDGISKIFAAMYSPGMGQMPRKFHLSIFKRGHQVY
jgi:hypothetical protein